MAITEYLVVAPGPLSGNGDYVVAAKDNAAGQHPIYRVAVSQNMAHATLVANALNASL